MLPKSGSRLEPFRLNNPISNAFIVPTYHITLVGKTQTLIAKVHLVAIQEQVTVFKNYPAPPGLLWHHGEAERQSISLISQEFR
jgi:hypothetical protein